MMQAMLDDAVERGEHVAILTASEWPIYGRFGFGPASERISFDVRTTDVQFLLPRSGSVSMVGVDELRSIAPGIYDRIAPTTVGALSRDPQWWDMILNVDIRPGSPPPKNRVRVVWRDEAGAAQGYVIYDPTENWADGVPTGNIQIREMFAATGDAHRELWRYLCEIDLVETVRANHRPIDDPVVHHLVDGRSVRIRARLDHLWLRLLDLRTSLGSRTYAAPGRIVFDVEDPMFSKVSRWAVEGGPEGATATPTDDLPDLSIGVTELGAAYLGGVSFAALATAGRVTENSPGSIIRADAMFSVRPLPYLTTNF
jgi:predicted acetyltransferase